MRWARYGRYRQLTAEFAKFAVIGGTGVVITNAVYDLCVHFGMGPVESATVATVVAAIGTYLGNRYWSFRRRQRTGVVREVVVFAVLNGIGLLIQDATVAVNSGLLGLGHHALAAFIALNTGIVLATIFRFWSYRRFVWLTPVTRPGAGRLSGRAPSRDRRAARTPRARGRRHRRAGVTAPQPRGAQGADA